MGSVKKEWTPRTKLKVENVQASADTQQRPKQRYDFQGLVEHVVGRISIVSLRERERDFLRVVVHKSIAVKYYKTVRTVVRTVYP